MKSGFKRYMVVVFIIILAFFLFSCSIKRMVVSKEEISAPERILEEIKMYNENIAAVKGSGILMLKEDKNLNTYRYSLSYSKDFRSMKIDLKDFIFKKNLITLIKTKNSVIVYDYLKRKKYDYQSASEFFKKIIKIDIPLESISELLLMKFPLIKGKYRIVGEGENKIKLVRDDISEEIEINRIEENIIPLKITFFKEDKILVGISYSDPRKFDCGLVVPGKLNLGYMNKSLSVEYKNLYICNDAGASTIIKSEDFSFPF